MPVKLWKMVDAEFADHVQAGGLRIGSLMGYKALENGRADPGDGGLTVVNGVFATDGSAARDRDIAARLGVALPPPSTSGAKTFLLMEGNRLEEQVRNCYAFCMTLSGNTYDPDPSKKPKAIFEIERPFELMELLAVRLSGYLKSSAPGAYNRRLDYVTYRERTVDVEADPYARADPLIKDVAFRQEREVRMVFVAPDGTRVTDPYDLSAPDEEVAALLRRLSEAEVQEAAAKFE